MENDPIAPAPPGSMIERGARLLYGLMGDDLEAMQARLLEEFTGWVRQEGRQCSDEAVLVAAQAALIAAMRRAVTMMGGKPTRGGVES